MVGEFTAFIKHHALFTENDTVLLAVSGGIDSVVMTDLFAQSSYRFAVAHANFGLRGMESDEDERWVAALAQRYGASFHTRRFATLDYADRQGISTQMAARRLRYAWFKELLDEQGYDQLATAHHLDDQLETALLNLCQGTGIAGLRGMPVRRGHLVRPLLFASRARIEAYRQAQQLEWREDRSNASDAYRRNRIRHHVVPQLQQINPNLLNTYQLTQERLLATEQLLADEVRRVTQQCRTEQNGEIRLDKNILKNHAQSALLLAEILRPVGFTYVQAREVAECLRASANVGKQFYTSDYTLLVDREFLIISRKSSAPPTSLAIHEEDTQVRLPGQHLTVVRAEAEAYTLTTDPNRAAIDQDCLSFPLEIRPWRTGDWFCPLGMNHRKKLSDFLIDQKVPRHRKSSVYVLTSGDAIVWVVGLRLDHRFRVTDQTRRVYEISLTTH